jgi:hypothetical protein
MKHFTKKVKDIVEKNENCPLPLGIIPNNMGINLCSVDSISWTELPDGQLNDLTIKFIPKQ